MKKFLELLKRFINALPTLTQRKKMREFVGNFNEFFENLKEWTEDAVQIRTWREHFF